MKDNQLFIGLIGALIVVMGGLIVFLKTHKEQQSTVPLEGLRTETNLARTHMNEPVTYDTVPPLGGAHSPTWASCAGKVYDQPLPNEKAVHSLEHGAVWITHQPSLDATSIIKLAGKVTGNNYLLMSPVSAQKTPIVLTAWGIQLDVMSADDPRIDQFIQKYRQGEQTPEPGASCQ